MIGSRPAGTDVIDSIDLPILVVNRDCAVVSFNPAAATLLSLMSSDVGRPLGGIQMLTDVKDLEELCEHVIGGGASSHREVRDGTGSWFSLRIGPYKASNQKIAGAVLTLTNVTAFRASLEQAIDEREYTKAVLNTVIDPLVVLDEDLRVQAANQAFYAMFQASREVTREVRLYELGKPDWDIPRLRTLLNEARPTNARIETLEVDHEFPAIGRRTLLLNARRLSRGDHLGQMTLVAIQDITDRKRSEQKLAESISEQRRSRMLAQGQKEAFEQAGDGAPIDAVLGILTRTAQEQSVDSARAAIFIIDAEGACLRPGAAAGIPESYMRAQDGFPVGPQFPSYGMAAYTGQTVIVPDVEQDPLWTPYLHLAREHGFRACWSFPIRSFGDKVLGTFALYHRAPCEPDLRDIELVKLLADTAAVLIGRHKEAEERQRAEEALRRAEQELRDFVENATVGLHWVGPDGIILWANRTELEMLGCTKEEYIGHHIAEFHADQAAIEDILQCLQNHDTLHEYEARLRCKDGSIREVLISSNVLWEDDKFIHTRCFTRDITDRKRALEALSTRTAQFETLLNQAPLGVYLVDADLRIQQVNPTALSVFGNIPDLIGRDFDEVIHILWPKTYADEIVQVFRHTLDTGEPYITPERIEERLDRGVTEYYEWRIDRIPLPEGRFGVVCYFRDISAHVLARQALHDSEEALKEADRRKDEFLATLAHELRNPLVPVRNAVQVLRLKGPDEPEVRWGRDVIERQVEHLARLIDDLLDISRIARNKLELRKERVALADVVKGAVETSRPAIEQCGHELTVTLPPEPVYLHADLVRLAQVFMNLLNNAAKYMERGGRIWLIAELASGGRQPPEVVVRVKDTGVGIPAEKLPSLFEMFFQVDRSLERSQGGLGIGLSLVRRLVELHGGRVEARSAGVGKGSEFIVRLPVLVEKPKPQVPQQPSDNGGAKSMTVRRVLVVDDNRDSADSLAMLLRLTGNQVHTAYDGLEGVEAAEGIRPDVWCYWTSGCPS